MIWGLPIWSFAAGETCLVKLLGPCHWSYIFIANLRNPDQPPHPPPLLSVKTFALTPHSFGKMPKLLLRLTLSGFMGKLDFTSCRDEAILKMLGRLGIRFPSGGNATFFLSSWVMSSHSGAACARGVSSSSIICRVWIGGSGMSAWEDSPLSGRACSEKSCSTSFTTGITRPSLSPLSTNYKKEQDGKLNRYSLRSIQSLINHSIE